MIRFCTKLERVAFRRMWDGTPAMGLLQKSSSPGRFRSAPFAFQHLESGVSAPLLLTGEAMRRRLFHDAAPAKPGDPIVGLWVAYVIDAKVFPDGDKLDVSYLTAIDCAGRVINVSRVTGMRPRILVGEGAGGHVGNPIVCGLRDILLQLVANLPDGEVDLVAISRIGTAGG